MLLIFDDIFSYLVYFISFIFLIARAKIVRHNESYANYTHIYF